MLLETTRSSGPEVYIITNYIILIPSTKPPSIGDAPHHPVACHFPERAGKVANICGGSERGAAKVTLGRLQSRVKCSRAKGLSEQVTPLLPHPPSAGRPRPSEAGRAGRTTGRGWAYLLPEVDGYVGDAEGHQEPDQGPVVRERREFHHSPRRGLTPHSSAAARALCWEARGAERGAGTEAAAGGAWGGGCWRRRRPLQARLL